MVTSTKAFCAGDFAKAEVLVIGHDPRLQRSRTQAEYAFFGDYYFWPVPRQRSDLAKYQLAQAVFDYVGVLTSHRVCPDRIILTNLCNSSLPQAPKGKTVLIPEREAKEGIKAINSILEKSTVRTVFAMSEQVNYWLQALGFYPEVPKFLSAAEPKERGVDARVPFYEPKGKRAFQGICGKPFVIGRYSIYPILHVKNWLLKGGFVAAYGKAYERLEGSYFAEVELV